MGAYKQIVIEYQENEICCPLRKKNTRFSGNIYVIGDEPLEKDDHFKFLGVIIDSKWLCVEHIWYGIYSKGLNLMQRQNKILPHIQRYWKRPYGKPK